MDGISERTEESSFLERLVDIVCNFQPLLFYLFVIEVILLVLGLFALAFIDTEGPSYMILQLDLLIIGSTFLATAVLLFHCHRRERSW